VLKGAAFGALGSGLTFGVGAPLGADLGDVLGSPLIGNFIAQGLTGGITSVAGGGNFGSGFLAAGVGSLGGSLSDGSFDTGKMILSSALGGASSILGGGKFENGAITGAFAYAANSLSDEEGLRSGGSAQETGNDATVNLSKLAGVSTCGNSLCGNIPVGCSGSGCGLVMDQLTTFAQVNSLNLAFSKATGWQSFLNYVPFSGVEVLDVNFYSAVTANGFSKLGDACCGVLNLYGNSWQSNSVVVSHEFSHDLGLGHNGATGTLMYPIAYPNTPTTLQPGERQNLLNAYGH
jgi:hypothetical protein